MMQAGDEVYVLITDHPDFPDATHEGDGGYFADEAIAARIAAAWTSYQGPSPEWPWRVEKRILRERRRSSADADGQLDLWGY